MIGLQSSVIYAQVVLKLWCAMYYGRIFPGFSDSCVSQTIGRSLQQFGVAEEELYVQWLPFLDYVLACADEAHELIATSTLP